MFLFTHMHVCVLTYTCTYLCTLLSMSSHAYMLLHVFAYVHALNVSTMLSRVHTHAHPVQTCAFLHVFSHAYPHAHTQHIHTSPCVLIHMCSMSSHMYASPCVPYMHASLFACMCSHRCMLAHDRAHVSSSATVIPCWAVVQATTNPKTALSYVSQECGPREGRGMLRPRSLKRYLSHK